MTSEIRSATNTNPVVTLRPLTMGDRDCVRRWMADPAVINFTVLVPGPEYGPVEPYDAEAADRYLECLVRDPDRRSFAIEVDQRHVGNVGLRNYDPNNPVAECFIEIGEGPLRRRGVGRAAMVQLLELAFGIYGVQRVRLGVFEFNVAAIRLYRSLGFDDDGEYGSHYVEGRYFRVIAMAVDRQGWIAQRTVGR